MQIILACRKISRDLRKFPACENLLFYSTSLFVDTLKSFECTSINNKLLTNIVTIQSDLEMKIYWLLVWEEGNRRQIWER